MLERGVSFLLFDAKIIMIFLLFDAKSS